MLYWLTQHLALVKSGFHVFSYLTLRAILAMTSALALSLLVGPGMIARLSRYQIGQVVRNDGPKSHLPKAGTPTMGGALILVATLVSTLLWADLANRFVWTVLAVTFAFGLIGFYDDYLKLVVGNSRGLTPRWKYLWQSVGRPVAAATALLLGGNACGDDVLSAVLQDLRRAARRRQLHRHRLSHDRRHEQCGESHRWARWPGDHAGSARDRRARRVRLCQRQRGVRQLSVDSGDPACRRAADFLRGAGGVRARISVVQRLSRAGVHGRRRRARDRRCDRRAWR